MRHIIPFDPLRHHIYLEVFVTDNAGSRHTTQGILDTGAPKTEFSNRFLSAISLIPPKLPRIELEEGLQTQKYDFISLPSIELCGYKIKQFEIFVSRFHHSWGIDALIGLDFFRLYSVGINYEKAVLITEPFSSGN